MPFLIFGVRREPTLVLKDIRGFINNRLTYAMYRETFYLVKMVMPPLKMLTGPAVYNAGSDDFGWGFSWMDLTACRSYHNVLKDLFPELNNKTEIPKLIDDIVKEGGKKVLQMQRDL